jgi:hypothetical protein
MDLLKQESGLDEHTVTQEFINHFDYYNSWWAVFSIFDPWLRTSK